MTWVEGTSVSLNDKILKTVAQPFQQTGGLQRLTGNLGEAVIKISAGQTGTPAG